MPNRVFEPTDIQRQQVQILVNCGVDLDRIARLVVNPHTGRPISRLTLSRKFASDIETAKDSVKQRLLSAMLKNALVYNNPTTQIFLAKKLLGWDDRQSHEISGPGGKPLQVMTVYLQPGDEKL